MKKFVAIVVALILPWTAAAQQPSPPTNHEATVYQQLLTEANDRLAKTAARAQQLETENQSLKSRLAAEAKKAAPQEAPKQ